MPPNQVLSPQICFPTSDRGIAQGYRAGSSASDPGVCTPWRADLPFDLLSNISQAQGLPERYRSGKSCGTTGVDVRFEKEGLNKDGTLSYLCCCSSCLALGNRSICGSKRTYLFEFFHYCYSGVCSRFDVALLRDAGETTRNGGPMRSE